MYDLALEFANKCNFSDPKSWLIVTGIALVVGFICLKGINRG